MGDIVIVAYRPFPGREQELRALAAEHVPILRRLGLATDREAIIAATPAGTIVEIFEWVPGAIAAAHEHPEVAALWARYAEICDYMPLADLPEAQQLFAQFSPLD